MIDKLHNIYVYHINTLISDLAQALLNMGPRYEPMEDVIVYQTNISNPAEVSEYFHHQGFKPKQVHSLDEISSLYDDRHYTKLFVEINSLSDILSLKTVRVLYPGTEIILIVCKQLAEIIQIIRNNHYKTIEDITQIKQQRQQ